MDDKGAVVGGNRVFFNSEFSAIFPNFLNFSYESRLLAIVSSLPHSCHRERVRISK